MKFKKPLAFIFLIIFVSVLYLTDKNFSKEVDSQLDSIDVSLTKNQISGEELNKKIEEKSDIIILDVRFEEEYLNGHIPAAKLLSMNLISKEKLFNLIPVE